mgnify:CR=1 FL=1
MSTAPKGFRFATACAGFRKEGRADLALLVSDVPAVAAGTFTQNRFPAAPVLVAKAMLAERPAARAVVINSGQANACTGDEGMRNCRTTQELVAGALGLEASDILPASTGVIGAQLKMDLWEKAAPALAANLGKATPEDFAKAIMTTDAFHKISHREVSLPGGVVKLVGMAKGAGMICPNMATMLVFITSDCAISPAMLQKALSTDIANTFNMVSVDGDTSTNDMVTVLANGLAGNAEITEEGADFTAFMQALNTVTVYLCRCIAGDGEGATKLLECIVKGAPDENTARVVAKSVISSSLVKAAMFAADANWGRILCAIGYAKADFDITKVSVELASEKGKVTVCTNGAGVSFSEESASEILSEDEIKVLVDLHCGEGEAIAWGCDLTFEYVKINAEYRT